VALMMTEPRTAADLAAFLSARLDEDEDEAVAK
jgi:hypothetical protein